MKKNNKTELQKLAESFLDEVITMISEDHQTGDWWIDETGEVKRMDGHMTKEDSEHAMKAYGWKKMKSHKKDENIEIETWSLKAEDLKKIDAGVRKILTQDNDALDKDKIVKADNYAGPRLRITVKSKNKTYRDVPYALLKRYLPSDLRNYGPESINEDYHVLHKDYRLYEGYDSITAVFEDNSRLKFEVHYHDKHGLDREKHRRKALTCWKSLANEIHRNVELNEVGNPMEKSWRQSFEEALKHPKLQEYIRQPFHQKVFDEVGL